MDTTTKRRRWIALVVVGAVPFVLLSVPSIFDAGMSSTRYWALFFVLYVFSLYLFFDAIGYALYSSGLVSWRTWHGFWHSILGGTYKLTYVKLHYAQNRWPYRVPDDMDDKSIDPWDRERLRKL